MIPKTPQPTHPGGILLEEHLTPLSISQVELARRFGVPVQRASTLISGRRGIIAETALLPAREPGASSEFRMNLQACRDLCNARVELRLAA